MYTLIGNEELRLRSEVKSQPKLPAPAAFFAQTPFSSYKPRSPNQPNQRGRPNFPQNQKQPRHNHNRQNNIMLYGGPPVKANYILRSPFNQNSFRPPFNQQYGRPRFHNGQYPQNQNFQGNHGYHSNNNNYNNRNQYPHQQQFSTTSMQLA